MGSDNELESISHIPIGTKTNSRISVRDFFASRSYSPAIATPGKIIDGRTDRPEKLIPVVIDTLVLNSHRTLPTYARRNRIVAYVVGKRLGFEFSFHACHEVPSVAQKHPFFH